MKILIIILCIILDLFMTFLTIGLNCLNDRLDGISAQDVYSDMTGWILFCTLFWPFVLLVNILMLLWRFGRKWMIAAIEIIVAKNQA